MTHTVTVESGDGTQVGWMIEYCEATVGNPPEDGYRLIRFEKNGSKHVGSVTLDSGRTWILRCNVALDHKIGISLSPGGRLISPWRGEWPISVTGRNTAYIYVLVGEDA